MTKVSRSLNSPRRCCKSNQKFVFIGEKPSPRAIKIGANWLNGKLAAKTLHDALYACGIDPLQQRYINLFGDNPAAPSAEIVSRIRLIRALSRKGYQIVALGR